MAEIETRLFKDADGLKNAMRLRVTKGCDLVVLLSLGLPVDSFIPFAQTAAAETPVFLADCYGILGFSEAEGRNVELMEAGRGREYGGVGGDGGEGVVAVLFTGGIVASSDMLPAEDITAHMVVATHGSNVAAFLKRNAAAPYYGGLAKATYRYAPGKGTFEPVPYFMISTRSGRARTVGTTSFTRDPKESLSALLDRAPKDTETEAVALFPCFMRGRNIYEASNVEPDAVSELLPGVPIFGMFCHGELGPTRCLGFDAEEVPQKSCTQHSMTSIVAVHARKVSG